MKQRTILFLLGLLFICCGQLVAHSPARAYAMSNETSKAKNAYQEFLTLWKDADPNLSVLRNAKSEYANLQQSSQM
jgi:hypothetical protein